MPTDEYLNQFYNSSYRNSKYGMTIEGKYLDTPVQIPWIGISLLRFKNFYETLKECDVYLKPKDIVLDYGAYLGIFLYAVREIFECKVLGLDVNKDAGIFSKANYNIDILTEDIYRYFPSSSNNPSLVTFIHSFEHLKFPQRFLSHLKRNVLQKGSYVYIEVPNFFGYTFSFVHHYHYSQESLSALLQRNGFKILKIFCSGFPEIPKFDVGESHPSWLICLAKFGGGRGVS